MCPTVQACRRVPLALLPKVKEKLTAMERNGIITKRDEPTAWVNSMLIVEKKDGSIRLCLDPRELNKAIMREHYTVPTFDDVLPQLSGKSIFSIIDMKDGFWHVELDDESSRLVTFNTPFGRYSFTRLPFGISSAPEVFQKRAQQTFGDIEGVAVIFDDIIIAASSVEEHDMIFRKLLERAREYNVRFNRSKLQLMVDSVVYMGHVVSSSGISPDPSKVRAIIDFTPPSSREDLMRFNGMATYVSRYIPKFADLTFPYRQLLKKDAPWSWAEPQQEAFNTIKKLIAQAPVLGYYDQSKPLVIQTDASSKGLGSCLLQDGHPVSFASRALTDCETRYAQIEKELLAIVFACEKFNNYAYGRDVLVQSDHKPLEAIFSKPLSSTTPRLQRMLIRLGRYRLHIKYTPGKEMHIADALSRAYLQDTTSPEEKELAEDLDVMVHAVLCHMPDNDTKLDEIRKSTAADPVLSQIMRFSTEGLPTIWKSLPVELRNYRQILPELYTLDGIVLKDRRMVIPALLRTDYIKRLHSGHMGIEKTKKLARQYYYWPGMDYDIEVWIRRCSTCNANKRKQTKQPLMQHPVPDYPWQKVGCDIFTSRGQDYLLTVDYFSKFAEVSRLKRKTANAVIVKLKTIFSRFGVPETLMADNVPFASMEFRKFAKCWNFHLVTSSPNYPQSNGQAERAIQTIKRLMLKAHQSGEDVEKALLHLRATQVSGTSVSPAELLFNRPIRTDLPAMSFHKKPTNSWQLKQELIHKQETEKRYADRGSRSLQSLNPGETVRIQLGSQLVPGRVLQEIQGAPRTYRVATSDGLELRRNRLHLHQSLENTPHVNITAQEESLAVAMGQASQSRPIKESSSASQDSSQALEQVFTEATGQIPQPAQQTTTEATDQVPLPAQIVTSPRPLPRRSTRIRRRPDRYSP